MSSKTPNPTAPDPVVHLDANGLPAGRRPTLYDCLIFRVSGEQAQERAQAVARVLIVGLAILVAASLAAVAHPAPVAQAVLACALGYGLFAVVYLYFVTRAPQRWPWRRFAIVACDLGIVGLVSHLTGSAGLGLYPLFLWIIVGNGVRFGPTRLALATAIGVPLFALVHLTNGAAAAQPAIFIGLLVGLVVLPKFMHQALLRMAEANRELARRKEEAEYLASHDALTGLPNRHLLLQRLDHAITRARRSGSPLALMFLDLDGFKRINDSLGHDRGDELLVRVADCLRATMREVDTVCRLGGDEFILLIEEYATERDITAIVERLFGCARRFYRIGDTDAYVTWSCGIAVFPKDGEDGGTLMKNADIAMYRAKANGSNCAVSYDPAMSRQLLADLRLRNDLRRALESDELFLVYQPQVDATDGRIVAIEALVRWQHPLLGLLGPDSFLHLAIASGMVAEVDKRVLKLALGDLAQLRRAGATGLGLALNMHAQLLASPDFADRLLDLLGRHRLDPALLEIEITEDALLDESAAMRELFRRLRSRGLRFALDDFGSGFSSLAHLRHFSIDRLKIDPSFVRGLPGDDSDCAMLEGILAITARLGLAVAAEGVETQAQRDWLLAHGCTRQQGFHYGGPQDLARLRPQVLAGSAEAATDD